MMVIYGSSVDCRYVVQVADTDATEELLPTIASEPMETVTPNPNRVEGEYIAGGKYRVTYVADEFGFHARVVLRKKNTNNRVLIKPQSEDGIGCALRNSLCGRK